MNCTIRLLGDVNLSSPTATVVATAAAADYSLSALPLYLFIVVLIAVGFTLVNGYRMSSRPSANKG
ncbi:hypothetical protein TIFTF001_004845 [Ficus carica]|uniref:Uncharacterized protein n=1 Tax=Ficus carica TaxID=3494 RepID=A0AA88CYJ8_FICCA|nr:hypothetical protein TIFTF001_004845 [Ficus carica]